jgi:hypothetical protein
MTTVDFTLVVLLISLMAVAVVALWRIWLSLVQIHSVLNDLSRYMQEISNAARKS